MDERATQGDAGRPRKTESVTIRIEPALYQRLVHLSVLDDRPVTAVARRALERGLPLLETERAHTEG